MARRHLVLASSSPRRVELLTRLGLRFETLAPNVDESLRSAEDPGTYVRRMALAKSETVTNPDAIAIAADTAVVVDSQILGKPDDETHGRQMLSRLLGREHEVVTGVSVRIVGTDAVAIGSESTTVHVADLSDVRVDWYLESGEGADKAGGYALQGAAALFADRVSGSVSNVIGLPLPLVDRLCTDLGVDLLSFRGSR